MNHNSFPLEVTLNIISNIQKTRLGIEESKNNFKYLALNNSIFVDFWYKIMGKNIEDKTVAKPVKRKIISIWLIWEYLKTPIK